MNTAEYARGTRDAERFTLVQRTDNGWVANLVDTDEPALIAEPDKSYLQGLYDAGCKLRNCGEVRRPTQMELLLDRVQFLMKSA